MAEDLNTIALTTVDIAQDYVRRRTGNNPDEDEYLRQWSSYLQNLSGIISSTASSIAPDQPEYVILSQKLNLTRQQIGFLHEYYSLDSFDLVFHGLTQQVAMIAGPHGPGVPPARPPRRL